MCSPELVDGEIGPSHGFRSFIYHPIENLKLNKLTYIAGRESKRQKSYEQNKKYFTPFTRVYD